MEYKLSRLLGRSEIEVKERKKKGFTYDFDLCGKPFTGFGWRRRKAHFRRRQEEDKTNGFLVRSRIVALTGFNEDYVIRDYRTRKIEPQVSS
jgi:hypothetical protein